MQIYLNAGFGEKVGLGLVRSLIERGYDGIRQDIPLGAPEGHVSRLLKELDLAGTAAIVIVGGWMEWRDGRSVQSFKSGQIHTREAIEFVDLVAGKLSELDLRKRTWLEVGNEPDITDQFSEDPDAFAAYYSMLSTKAVQICPELERRCVVGGVSNLRKKGGFKYLRKLLEDGKVNSNAVVGLHPYRPEAAAWDPFDDWARLNDAVWELRQRLDGRRFTVTEMGWHTAEQRRRKLFGRGDAFRWTDGDVRNFYLWERDFWLKEGAPTFTWYQLNDGPEDTSEQRFGIRFADGTWKPVADAVKEVVA